MVPLTRNSILQLTQITINQYSPYDFYVGWLSLSNYSSLLHNFYEVTCITYATFNDKIGFGRYWERKEMICENNSPASLEIRNFKKRLFWHRFDSLIIY